MEYCSAMASGNQITVTWDGALERADLYRSGDGGANWQRIVANITGGRWTDSTARPGKVYFYRAERGGESAVSLPVWIVPVWGWNTLTQALTANDLVNRPTLRARILDSTSRTVLQPETVTRIRLAVFSVFDNDVTAQPRFRPLSEEIEVDPLAALLPNLVTDGVWFDETGFNFSHVPPFDLEPGDYAFRYTLETDSGQIFVHFRYHSECRRA